jgi:glycosyltransferase involved in cell wall biosynthesis
MPFSVTIVTPSYNQGRFIERTIRSVLSQDIPGLEYLVFDGGSTDETVAILKRYESQLSWVSEKDRGQADAVNKGLLRARGDVIGWLNSDDVYYPGAIKSVCDFFAANPGIELVYGDGNHIDEHDGVIEAYPTEDWDFDRFLDACYFCQPAVFFRRSVIEKCGVLDPRRHFCLDYEYWIRLAKRGTMFARLRQTLAGSRLYAETKTMGSRLKFHSEINNMLQEHCGRVPDRWLFNYAHVVVDEKGIPRSNAFRFNVMVAAASLQASWRWNGRVSAGMFHTTREWVRSAAQSAFKELVKK